MKPRPPTVILADDVRETARFVEMMAAEGFVPEWGSSGVLIFPRVSLPEGVNDGG